MPDEARRFSADAIAVIGMACRFPGADTPEAFWENLRTGTECITFFTAEEMLAAGVDPAEVHHPDYVPARAILDRVEWFDAKFFGYSPREAQAMDPQERLFLLCAWEAMERAGYAGTFGRGRVGVFAGTSSSAYLQHYLRRNPEFMAAIGEYQVNIVNHPDFLPTQVSYRLDLTGPSVNVNTACSTSLVAVQLACQSLLVHQSDLALAGASQIDLPQRQGHLHRQGMIHSSDGHCRPYDVNATGIVNGNGAGVVALRRLEDALADGDPVLAVILGAAVNNDGAQKMGYSAPSVDGQAEVIREAQAMAGVEPATITYVEGHGTGTAVGDPIELAGLAQAFRAGTDRRNFCGIGSVKSNVGHLDRAAGMAGLIKTILALQHGLLPPSLHYTAPNPAFDMAASPFFVVAAPTPWQPEGFPRRAGVSSFGIGGTNAHVVLEEAPPAGVSGPSRARQLVVLSAKTKTALAAARRRLREHLAAAPDLALPDLAWTLAVGRAAFPCRQSTVVADTAELADWLAMETAPHVTARPGRSAVFLFPGQGAQHPGMLRGLRSAERVIERTLRESFDILAGELDTDPEAIIYPADDTDEAAVRLARTVYAQPALVATEIALARWWLSLGVAPRAMIGHSVGEYAAACLAGVMSLPEALRAVAARGRLMQACPPGAMLSVALDETRLAPYLGPDVDVAAVNTPDMCVVSGPFAAVESLERTLRQAGIASVRLHTSHAFHSAMMDPVLDPIRDVMRGVDLRPPQIPFISSVTGDWITDVEATDPDYWARQVRRPVRFAAGVTTLLAQAPAVLLEVGPGTTLVGLARRHPAWDDRHAAVASCRHPRETKADEAVLRQAVGSAWSHGVAVDWPAYYAGERRRRVVLPTYPFEEERYWVEPRVPAHRTADTADAAPAGERAPVAVETPAAGRLYRPVWRETPGPAQPDTPAATPAPLLLLGAAGGFGRDLADHLAKGYPGPVVRVTPGARFVRTVPGHYELHPDTGAEYDALLGQLAEQEGLPARILVLWDLAPPTPAPPEDVTAAADRRAFYRLMFLVQAMGRRTWTEDVSLLVATAGAVATGEDETIQPGRALPLGLVNLIPREYAQVRCRAVDVVLPAAPTAADRARIAGILSQELAAAEPDGVVARRGDHRLTRRFEPLPVPAGAAPPPLRHRGVYLITGGTGGIGRALADRLARDHEARLVLTSRTPLPERTEWPDVLQASGTDRRTAGLIRDIQAWEAAGARVMTATADVADAAAMRTVIAAAVERFGALHGVIHAAGRADYLGVIQNRTPAATDEILAPKVTGTLVLDTLTRSLNLDFFALCSSMAVVRYENSFGQAGYCAANEFLDAFAWHRRGRGEKGTVTINWDAWREAGMALDAARRRAARTAGGSAADHRSGAPYPGTVAATASGRTEQHWSLSAADWIVAEHRLAGRPLVPGTAYLAWAADALRRQTGGEGVELRDVIFLRPLQLDEGETRPVRLTLETTAGVIRFGIASQPSPGGEWTEHARGELAGIAAETVPGSAWSGTAGPPAAMDELPPWPDAGPGLAFGPRWHLPRRIARTADGSAWLRIDATPQIQQDLAAHPLHPALLDLATGFPSELSPSEEMFLPYGYDRIRLYGPLTAPLFSRARIDPEADPAAETRRFDLTMYGADGTPLADVAGYTLRRLSRPVTSPAEPVPSPVAASAGASANVRLTIAQPGRLASLAYGPADRPAPGPEEVEIAVRAAGLNFRDVLMALGLIPGVDDQVIRPGFECSGVVSRVGAQVTDFRPGDAVMAAVRGGFARYVTTPAFMVSPTPEAWSYAQAAAVPVAYGTAYYCLVTVARLQPGESVLIHAAAGGVGLAAVAVARRLGCTVYATAGRKEKQEYLQAQGVRHVMSSRTLDFADEIMRLTDGRGVDVVLNSLADEFIPKSLGVLAPYGRFVEIGIRDILNDTAIGLAPFARGLSYTAVMVGPQAPGYTAAWQEMAGLVRSGGLPPLPVKIFPVAETVPAFEYMAQARHIGKIVVERDDAADAGAVTDTAAVAGPAPPAGAPDGLMGDPVVADPVIAGLSHAEGAADFLQALAAGETQLAVALEPPPAEPVAAAPAVEAGPDDAAADEDLLPRTVTTVAYAPPRDDRERTLVRIWEQTLGVRPVGIHDDFFELGGHSLLAVTLFDRMNQRLGRKMQISMLFEASTVARLAEAMGEGGTPPAAAPPAAVPEAGHPVTQTAAALVPGPAETATAPRPTLVLVHNIVGEVVSYLHLARQLAPDITVVALSADIADGSYREYTALEQMAAAYLDRLEQKQMTGPLCLFGHSTGGFVALEMARQLQARGREVPLLGLIDTQLDVFHKPAGAFRRADYWACYLRNLPVWFGHFWRDRGWRPEKLRRRLNFFRGGRYRHWYGRLDAAHQAYVDWSFGLLRAYRPQPYSGRLALFRVRALPLTALNRPDLGWGPYAADGLQIHLVPGDHMTILKEPHVAELAAEIRRAMEAAIRA